MRKLTKGWRRVKFGDVVRLSKERCSDPVADGIERFVGLEHLEPGDLRVRSWGDIGNGTTFTSRIRPGQVLFGKRRAYQRKVAVADFEAVCSGDIYVFEAADPKVLVPELLPFICQSDAFFEHAVGTSAGSLSPRTNWTSLAAHEFALPPVEEQRSIAECLVACAANVDALRGLLAAARNVVSSFRDDHFRGIPRSALSTLSSAVESSAYGPRFSADNYSAQGNVRSIRTTDMPVFGALTLDTAPAAVVPPEIATEHRLREADFLISRTGFTSGRAAVFRGADASTVFIPAAFLVRLRLDPRKLEPEYLLEYIQSTEGWEMIRGLQRGTQQLNISASGLVARTVPIPDLQCQRQALEQLSTLHAAADSTCRRIAQTQSLLRAAGAALMGSVS